MSKLIAILAHQRSGTNMLGWAIDTHPHITFTSELFHRNREGVPDTADELERALQGTRPRTRNGPSRPYLSDKVACLDVKYNQVTSAVEDLLRRIPVIHLVRTDHMRHWYSFQLRIWWQSHPEYRQRRELPASLPFDANQYDAFVTRLTNHQERLRYLADLTLYYEKITDNKQITELPDRVTEQICTLAGVEYCRLTVSALKSAIEMRWD